MTSTTIKSLAAAALLLSSPALAGDGHPLDHADGTMMALSGVVTGSADNGFMLDYGSGSIKVDLEHFDDKRVKGKMLDGKKVSVFGEIDDDVFERTELEAVSLYVNEQFTYLHSTSALGMHGHTWTAPERVEEDSLSLSGKVTSVDDDSFRIAMGSTTLKVDVDDLGYNPFDDKGWQKIDVGDVVRIQGEMDGRFFSRKVLEADSVVTVWDKS